MQQNPIDQITQAVASLYVEREKLLQLIRDYRTFASVLSLPAVSGEQRNELDARAKEALGESHE